MGINVRKNKKVIIISVAIAVILMVAGCSPRPVSEPVNENKKEEPELKLVTIELAVSDNNGGTVKGGGTIKAGHPTTIAAEAEDNYTFRGWYTEGELIATSSSHQLIPEVDKRITAEFSLKKGPYHVMDGDYLLALVTKNTYLGDYRPDDLVEIPKYMLSRPQWRYYLREEAAYYLEKMWDDAKSDGIHLYVQSAFRDYETQAEIFNNATNRHGEEIANKWSAKPGESEHQLGTAVDFVERQDGALLQSFANTKEGKWLMENAYKYGFALSYPEGKESITGYVFEPWHYRYIGVEAATQWKESEMALNKFLKEQPQNLELRIED